MLQRQLSYRASGETNLGIIVTEDLKLEMQGIAAAKKANKMPGMVKCDFVDRSKEIQALHKSLVRLHVEYCHHLATLHHIVTYLVMSAMTSENCVSRTVSVELCRRITYGSVGDMR